MKTKHLSKDKQKTQSQEFVYDCTDKPVGRAASDIAALLLGKSNPAFSPFLGTFSNKVKVTNSDKVIFTGNKINQKVYNRHTGYWGNMKTFPAKRMLANRPNEVVKLAVYGMLPKNKTRKFIMDNLIFEQV
jgi:large subunit ribosomal protein L13